MEKYTRRVSKLHSVGLIDIVSIKGRIITDRELKVVQRLLNV